MRVELRLLFPFPNVRLHLYVLGIRVHAFKGRGGGCGSILLHVMYMTSCFCSGCGRSRCSNRHVSHFLLEFNSFEKKENKDVDLMVVWKSTQLHTRVTHWMYSD